MPDLDKFNGDFLLFISDQYYKLTDVKFKNINLWNSLISKLPKEKQKNYLPKDKKAILDLLDKYSNLKDYSYLLREIKDFSIREKEILLKCLSEWFETNNSFENLKFVAKIVQNCLQHLML